MIQQSLLADTPRARRSDPETSHRAAARIKAIGALGAQQTLVLGLVAAYPGHTSAELAARYAADCGEPQQWSRSRPMIARRLPELVPVYLRRGEARLCAVTGSPSTTWWPL